MNKLVALKPRGEIQSREAFMHALSQVHEVLRDKDRTTEDVIGANRAADALRAWAKFDNKIGAEERKEVNRVKSRLALMLNAIAEREQPGGRGGRTSTSRGGTRPGPTAWLAKTLGMKPQDAQRMRAYAQLDASQRAAHDGEHFSSVVSHIVNGKSARPGLLRNISRLALLTNKTNTLRIASVLAPQARASAVRSARTLRAWLDAFINNCEQLQQRQQKEAA